MACDRLQISASFLSVKMWISIIGKRVLVLDKFENCWVKNKFLYWKTPRMYKDILWLIEKWHSISGISQIYLTSKTCILQNTAVILRMRVLTSILGFATCPRSYKEFLAKLRWGPAPLIFKLLVRYFVFSPSCLWTADTKLIAPTRRNLDLRDWEIPPVTMTRWSLRESVSCSVAMKLTVGVGRVHGRRSSLGCFRMLKRKMDLCRG